MVRSASSRVSNHEAQYLARGHPSGRRERASSGMRSEYAASGNYL